MRRSHEKKQTMTPDGYLTVKLSRDGEDRRKGVHVLVSRAFVDGYIEGMEVNHKDYNRSNNTFNNLEWVTHEENIKHTLDGCRHITQIRDMSGENNPNYGNHVLSTKYSEDKELAMEKQSRAGSKNGRATAIAMITPSGEEIELDYLGKCADYMISNKMVRGKRRESVSTYISNAAKSGKKYFGCNFRFC